MASYRPKSLDELNNMYDKTLAAEKAIKKGSSLLKEENFSVTSEEFTDKAKLSNQEQKSADELSAAVNEFISSFSKDEKVTHSQPESPKPQMKFVVPAPLKAEPEATQEATKAEPEKIEPQTIKAAPEIKTVSEARNVAEVESAPEEENEPVAEAAEKIPSETIASEKQADPFAGADRSVLMDEYMKIMTDDDEDAAEDAPAQKKLSRKEKKKRKKKEKLSQEQEQNNSEETNPAEESISEQPLYEEPEKEAEPDFVIEDNEQPKDDFDFPEDYTPEWLEEENTKDKNEKAAPKKRGNGKVIAAKTLLSVLLSFIILLGALTTVFKSVIAVNTGKAFADNYYVFTAYKDFYYANILEGDLVITEKKYAENGDDFAYINYANKTFDFAKRNDGITNDDGEILLIAENEGKRVLVSRDDCRGVVFATYPNVGRYIALLTDNFIVVIALLSVAALIIILVLALGLKNKNKSRKNTEAADTEPKAEDMEEDEDLFATID